MAAVQRAPRRPSCSECSSDACHLRLSLASPSAADSVRARDGHRQARERLACRPRGGRRAARPCCALIAGVGFANYDTLYALAWGGQLAPGRRPRTARRSRPRRTRCSSCSASCSRRSAHAEIEVVVALGYLALAGCGWVVFRLGDALVRPAPAGSRPPLFVSRVHVISYGVRAYVDVPYVLLVLWALLVASAPPPRRGARARAARAGRAAAAGGVGLLRRSTGCISCCPRRLRAPACGRAGRDARQLALTLLAAPRRGVARQRPAGHRQPAVVADQHAPHRRRRSTARPDRQRPRVRAAPASARCCGRRRSPAPRRRRAVAVVAARAGARSALGGVARGRRLRGVRDRRPADQHALRLPRRGDPLRLLRRRRVRLDAARAPATRAGAPWMAAAARSSCSPRSHGALPVPHAPTRTAQTRAPAADQGDLVALVRTRAISLRCGPVGVPNHAPIPLLALYLRTSPERRSSAPRSAHRPRRLRRAGERGSRRGLRARHERPHEAVRVPPGFRPAATNRSWLIFRRAREHRRRRRDRRPAARTPRSRRMDRAPSVESPSPAA